MVLTVKLMELPSFTDAALGVILNVGGGGGAKFFIRTKLLCATIDPVRLLVLILIVKSSSGYSLIESLTVVLTIVAIPVVAPVPTILNDPVTELSVKSGAVATPTVV